MLHIASTLLSAGSQPGHARAAVLPEPVRPLPAARFGFQDLDCEQVEWRRGKHCLGVGCGLLNAEPFFRYR